MKSDIYEEFLIYVKELKVFDEALPELLVDHLQDDVRNATERHLYSVYWRHRFICIISKYIKWIVENVPPGGKLLDFGGGTGVVSHFLATRLGFTCYVLDVDEKSLDICARRKVAMSSNVFWGRSFDAEDFDAVISFFSIREAYLGGADLLKIFTKARAAVIVDRNDSYFPRIASSKYGLTVKEVDVLFKLIKMNCIKKEGMCLMPKELSRFELSNQLSYPMWTSPIYGAVYKMSL